MGTVREDQYAFFIISRSVLLIIRNVSYKCCRENRNAYVMINRHFFENRALLLDNVEKHCRYGQATGDNVAHAH
jgi:hypothetical protein